jgi:RNA polymerase sigma-70 factor (ECF subfamily)
MSHLNLFTAHRRLLFDLAYRMLGRVTEAEDIVQETWLRWQRQDLGAINSPKAWLVAAATRLAIDHLRSAQRTREEYYGVWLPEPVLQAPERAPDESAALADSLTMAFMLMLERLTPDERAVFLLREVFDYDYADIARIVEKSEAACRQIVSRAKTHVARESAPPAPPSPRAQQIVQQFLAATASGDVRELMTLLTDDATLYSDGGGRVVAAGRPIRTADHVSRFFAGIRSRYAALPGLEFRPVFVNGRPGALMLGEGRLINAYSFDLVGDRIRAIYLVRNPDKLHHLALGAN